MKVYDFTVVRLWGEGLSLGGDEDQLRELFEEMRADGLDVGLGLGGMVVWVAKRPADGPRKRPGLLWRLWRMCRRVMACVG